MHPALDKAAEIEANRKRYEELKAAGDTAAPRALPPPTPRDTAPIAESAVIHRETIPGGWYTTLRLKAGTALRLVNTSGTSGVSLFAWNANDPSERYNSADTVKIQWTSELRKGRVLFSDMGRVLFSIIEDTTGAHDTIVGGSTPASNARKYGDAALRSTRENMLLAAGKHGLGLRDLAPVITFFAPVIVDASGRLVWRDGVVGTGDFVDLRAEMDVIIALSNCPHPLAPDARFAPGPIEAIVHAPPVAAEDDLCRTATAEARRGFDNNARQARI
ncbi:urea amidolyase associated protein UAAP1 [Kaistia soli]|nr:urea amidolyase associated protein UAAP1 [Kaistia soli]